MPFQCPTCEKPTLEITQSVELGPGADDDERTLQLIACPCGLAGGAYYRESRRGSGESWHHEGFVLDRAGIDVMRDHMALGTLPVEILRMAGFAMRIAS